MSSGATPASRRRDKVQLSCNLCRRRKLRCDRQLPCSTCASRGLSLSCTYPDDRAPHPEAADAVVPETFQGRINRLESLVVQLLQKTDSSPPASHVCARCLDPLPEAISSPAASDASLPGNLQQDAAKTVYVSNTHWRAVMDGISDLKSLCERDVKAPGSAGTGEAVDCTVPKPPSNRLSLLFMSSVPVSKRDILAALPDRATADRLVTTYFQSASIPHRILHRDSFNRKYQRFWEDPLETPLLWIGLLFSIMCLAFQAESARSSLLFNHGAAHHAMAFGFPQSSASQNKPPFLEQVEQCLIAGDYSSGGPYALETLLHYLVGEFMRYPDPDGKSWIMMGVLLRLALRAGYHRDPSHFPGISPFHAEMRRRTWTVIHGLDIMISLQMGLPRLIKDGQWDTMPPRNILDFEIDETTAELPPSRPESEITPMMHLLAKHRMLLVVGAIADATMNIDIGKTRVTAVQSQRKLMKRLRDTYDSIPDRLKFENMSNFAEDLPEDTLNRLSISILLQKGIIVLNWSHVMSRDTQREEPESLQAYCDCVSAALRILELQTIIDAGTQLGGHLVSLRLLLSSVVKHEFLMGTIVLTTHLHRKLTKSPLMGPDERDGEIEAALRRSRDVWIRQSARSAEAARVANLLTRLFGMMKSEEMADVDATGLASMMGPEDPSYALLAQFGILQHLQDLNGMFGAGVY